MHKASDQYFCPWIFITTDIRSAEILYWVEYRRIQINEPSPRPVTKIGAIYEKTESFTDNLLIFESQNCNTLCLVQLGR